MANPTPNESTPATVADAALLFQALGNGYRYAALRKLATAGPQSVNDLAVAANLMQSSMSRHMTLLWKVGAVQVVTPPDGDGRKIVYAIPPGLLRETPGGKEIDYGTCMLRVA